MRYLFVTLAFLCSSVSMAQENTDPASGTSPEVENRESASADRARSKSAERERFLQSSPDSGSIQLEISKSDLDKLTREKDNAKARYDSLSAEYDELRKEDSIKAERLREMEDYQVLKNENEKLRKAQKEADKRLHNIAANFLYIPYEDFSINKIAIPAFDAISNPELEKEHAIQRHLLESYQADIQQLLKFLVTAGEELSKPFIKDATEQLRQFKNSPFYTSYQGYGDWRNTYMGKRIVAIEKLLKAFDGNKNGFDVEAIKNELNSCLKTIEKP